jgi:hypothetical protein
MLIYATPGHTQCVVYDHWVTSRKTKVCKITYFCWFAEMLALPSGPHRPQISLTLHCTLIYSSICSGGQDPRNRTNFVKKNRNRQCWIMVRASRGSHLPPILFFLLVHRPIHCINCHVVRHRHPQTATCLLIHSSTLPMSPFWSQYSLSVKQHAFIVFSTQFS